MEDQSAKKPKEKLTMNELKEENNITIESLTEERSKKPFCYYTSVHTADDILSSKSFWVSNIESMNDMRECDRHKNNAENVHALCFCNSDAEKIPMWYLYAGVTGHGVRLRITVKKMIELLKSIKTVYPVIDEKEKTNVPIEVSHDTFEMRLGWIHYLKHGNKDVTVNYRRKSYEVTDYNETLFMEDNYFVKDYEWHYESEFRIVFINHTGISYDKIAVHIPDEVYKNLSVMFAPEVTEDDKKNAIKMNGFLNLAIEKMKNSKLSINMNLLERNKADIIQNAAAWIDEDNAGSVCKAIQEQQKCDEKQDRD